MGSPGPRRTGRRSTPIDSTLPRPHPTAAPTLRSRSARASSRGLRQRPDRGLRGGEDNIDVDSRPVRPSGHVVRDRIDERRGAGDRLDGEEALRVIPVRVGRIQEMARLGEGSRVHENPVERTARECPGNEANRIRGGLHGPDSHYADGDSHPSPFASAWGAVSAQLSTYEGSRWTNPYVVIRMLSKYVSSITASRPCTFPRAARERSAALPCGLCGVEPGWNVKDPSSTTPSRAP